MNPSSRRLFKILQEVLMTQKNIKSIHGDVVIQVDDWMLPILEKYYVNLNWKTGYVQCKLKANTKSHPIPLQRLVAKTPRGFMTHHINHDKNDYRLENLEIIDPKTHSHRQDKHTHHNNKPTSSKYIGVTWCKKHQKWYASLHVSGLQLNLGEYSDLEVAGAVHNYFVIVFYGQCEELNKVCVTPEQMAEVDFISLNKRVMVNLIKAGLLEMAEKLDDLNFGDVDFCLILGDTSHPK